MTELQFWQSFWFLVIGAALFLFLWLDGFDQGIGMTLPGQCASRHVRLIGTRFADFIMARGHVHRTFRGRTHDRT